MAPMSEQLVHPDDLVDAAGVAQVLGLANRTSVSVYQRRYPSMPRPVVDLGRGRTKLWSRAAMTSWALTADLRSPQAIAGAELEQLKLMGRPVAQSVFRSAYSQARQHALGGGRRPRQIGRARRAAYQIALGQALLSDPSFQVQMPDGWLNEA